MDRLKAFDPCTQFGGHRIESGMLVRIERIAAHRRDGDTVETGACWRMFLKAPVGVPVLGKERGGFVRLAFYGDNMLAVRQRGNERILAERSEIQREAFEIVIGKPCPTRNPTTADAATPPTICATQ